MSGPRRLSAALFVAAAAAACAGGTRPVAEQAQAPPEPRTGVSLSPAEADAAGIETATARLVERSEPLQAAGIVSFDERRTTRLGALVPGVVAELRVQVGDRVAQGTVVARIHSHVLHDAWAGYFKALAERQRAEAELAYAKTAEDRAAQLVADRALSPQELARARADATTAAQALAAARADVTRAEQELAHYGVRARPDVGSDDDRDVPVRSLIPGTVVERLATEGEAVTPGSPLLVISDLSHVWITAEIDEALVGRLAAGRAVAIAAPAYPGERFPGRLAAVGDVVNPSTRRVTLRVEAPNADRRLKPQMFVTVTLGGAAPRRVLVVPSRAVQAMEGEQVVFVRTAADRFVRRPVTTGTEFEGEVEITSGLAEGDVVATAGAFLLKSALVKPAGDEEP